MIETSELDDGRAGAAPAASGNGASVVHAYAPTLPATDPLAVARVRGEIGDELYASLFEMLLTEAASGLAEMRSALAGGDARELGERAHRLRGGAASLGATAMAETARELQDASRGGELVGAGELLDRLELELEQRARRSAPSSAAHHSTGPG